MKRRFLVVLCLSFFPVSLFSATFSIGLDTMALDALWTNLLTIRVEGVVSLDDGFSLRFPVAWVDSLSSRDVSFLDVGVLLDYHPFDDGIFVSLGVAEGAFFFGRDRPENDKCFLNEIAVGYTWRFSPHWFLEPKLQIRDPSGVFATEVASLKDAMGSYPMVRFSLVVGGVFLAGPSAKEKGSATECREGE